METDKIFIEEETPESIKMRQTTDDKEIDSTLSNLEKKYSEPEKDTSPGNQDPAVKPDTPASTEDKTDQDKKEEPKTDIKEDASVQADQQQADSEFTVTSDFIQTQPEENRAILEKYVGKSKTELAKASANAIAIKNPYLKGNEKAIAAMVEDFEKKPSEELISTLVDTQKELGQGTLPSEEKPKPDELPIQKITLPELPEDNPEVSKVLNKEVAVKLRKDYPDMPEDMDSLEYKEWERDLLDEGLTKANKFMKAVEEAQKDIKTNLQKVVYAEKELKNLWIDSPSELINKLSDEDLPKLKNLNDNWQAINNKALTEEVKFIKDNLAKSGISEKDLNIDLTLKTDDNGSLFNENLTPLFYDGENLDRTVLGQIGRIPYLRPEKLMKKFLFEHQAEIMNAKVNSIQNRSQAEVERLKADNLNVLSNKSSVGSASKIEDIRTITDDALLDKTMADIEARYKVN